MATYTHTSQTIKLENATFPPKEAVCGQSGSPSNDFSFNYAHLRFLGDL